MSFKTCMTSAERKRFWEMFQCWYNESHWGQMLFGSQCSWKHIFCVQYKKKVIQVWNNTRDVWRVISLTFDLNEHEFFIGHGTVVGTLLSRVHTAQTHAAEVFLTGQPSESNVGESTVLVHYKTPFSNIFMTCTGVMYPALETSAWLTLFLFHPLALQKADVQSLLCVLVSDVLPNSQHFQGIPGTLNVPGGSYCSFVLHHLWGQPDKNQSHEVTMNSLISEHGSSKQVKTFFFWLC